MAVDAYAADPDGYRFDQRWYDELCSVSHREYDTGFYYDSPADDPKLCREKGYIREKAYLALATDCDILPASLVRETEGGTLFRFTQRNKLTVGETAELLTPGKPGQAFRVAEMYDADGLPIDSAPHPSMVFYLRVPFEVHAGDILRAGN